MYTLLYASNYFPGSEALRAFWQQLRYRSRMVSKFRAAKWHSKLFHLFLAKQEVKKRNDFFRKENNPMQKITKWLKCVFKRTNPCKKNM